MEASAAKDTLVENVSGKLTSDLNRPFALLGIALCIPLILLGAAAAVLLVVALSAGTMAENALALLLIVPAVLGFACVRVLAVTIGDLSLSRPLLEIDSLGILDRRLGCGLIPWENVARIISIDPQQAGFILELHTPVVAKFSRMRAGALGIVWRLPPSAVYVSMQQAMGPHVAAERLLSVARQHGVPASSRRIGKTTSRSIAA